MSGQRPEGDGALGIPVPAIGDEMGIGRNNLHRYTNSLGVELELQKHRLWIVKGKGRTPAMIIRQPDLPEG
jgi:hypothetical protein